MSCTLKRRGRVRDCREGGGGGCGETGEGTPYLVRIEKISTITRDSGWGILEGGKQTT